MTGARYEIMIDGVGRTNRDTRDIAIEAAKVLNLTTEREGPIPRPRDW